MPTSTQEGTSAAAGPHIAVLGTGAIGAAIGSDMIRAGHDVTFVEQWPDHVAAMRRGGIRVDTPERSTTTPVHAVHLCDVATLRRPFDLVFLVVKAYDTRWACELVKPVLAPDGVVVAIQNGMTMDDVASIVGAHRSVGAVVEIAANMFTPGVVDRQVAPSGTWFALGAEEAGPAGVARAEAARDVLRHAGTVEVVDDIRSSKWMKLVANAAEFLPSAILDLPLRATIEVPGVRAVMDAAGTEALQVGLDLGHRMVPMFGQPGLEALGADRYAAGLLDAIIGSWTLPHTKVAPLHDWLKGRRAEVDEINGLVAAERRRLGGRAPVNERLAQIGRRIDRGELRPGPENVDLLTAALDSVAA